MTKAKLYKPPTTISRSEFLIEGSDSDFRRSIYALVQCVGRLLACRDAFGRELGMTPSQFAVLMGVAHSQGAHGVTIRDLAQHVALASTHVTTEVGRLEAAGFLAKRPNETDRRSVRVSLTATAEREIARATPFIRRVNDLLFQETDPQSLVVAHRVASQVIKNSQCALDEVKRHARQNGAASKPVTSRASKSPYRTASRSAGPNEAADISRRRRARARPGFD